MKLYRKKRRSCPMCKPHKMGLAKRFTDKEVARIKRDIKEIKKYA